MHNTIKIATLNVKGLNNKQKFQRTMTLLKSYKLDLILIQETNLQDYSIRNFLAQQWIWNSHWTSKVAILAGRKEIKFEEINEAYNGRILSVRFNFRHRSFLVTNVYAPPNIEDRVAFFNRWSPQIDEEVVNIVAGDFNVNLNLYENRISQAEPHNDPSRNILKQKMQDFIDTAEIIGLKPFLTFYQKTCGSHLMATRLDYIFVDANHGQFCNSVATRYGNSDHLLVECEMHFAQEHPRAACWKFDKGCWSNIKLRNEVEEELRNIKDITKWDRHKCIIQSIVRAYRSQTMVENRIQKLHKKLADVNIKIMHADEYEDLRLVAEDVNQQLQKELSLLAEKWQVRSKVKWIESGERSTKYFFMRYKARLSSTYHKN